MRQTVLAAFFEAAEAAGAAREAEAPLFCDLFCGLGGASEGAAQAGYVVALGVDACALALQSHSAQHPRAKHLLRELPAPAAELGLPAGPRAWHLHGSPPCTHFSASRNYWACGSSGQDAAFALVDWFIRLALASGASSWSMEQVAHPRLLRHLEALGVDFVVCNFADFGVPQTRTRVIAGSPEVVRRARETRLPRVSVRQALPDLPDNVCFVKHSHCGNHRRAPERSRCRAVTLPSFTVTQNTHTLVDREFRLVRSIRIPEFLVLQGCRRDWPLPRCGFDVQKRLVANAVPPCVMRQLLAPDGS